MKTFRLAAVASLALLLSTAGCRTGKPPYLAPPASGAPVLVDRYAAARLRVLVEARSDERVSPPWIEKAEKAADAVAAELGAIGCRISRGANLGWDVRVTVSAPLRGPDLTVVVDGNHKVLERLDANGAAWDRDELAALARTVRERFERSEPVAAIAGVRPPARPTVAAADPGVAATTAAPVPARRRLAVLDFRGAATPPVLGLLADQARAAAADAGRSSGTAVLTREAFVAALKEKGRPAEACADAACELEAARAAGADLLVTGEVTAVGEARVLVLKLVEAGTGTLVASRHAQGKDDLALLEAARPAAAALFQ